MKNLIRKILKEETGDFDWTKSVDPLDEFGDLFYGRGNYKTTGSAIALIHNGEVVWTNGYGFADKEKGIKVTPNTVFQAASISTNYFWDANFL